MTDNDDLLARADKARCGAEVHGCLVRDLAEALRAAHDRIAALESNCDALTHQLFIASIRTSSTGRR